MDNYKNNLLDEFEQVIVKIVRLDKYIYDNQDKTKSEFDLKEFEIMKRQLEHMNGYADSLKERISLYINGIEEDELINMEEQH